MYSEKLFHIKAKVALHNLKGFSGLFQLLEKDQRFFAVVLLQMNLGSVDMWKMLEQASCLSFYLTSQRIFSTICSG